MKPIWLISFIVVGVGILTIIGVVIVKNADNSDSSLSKNSNSQSTTDKNSTTSNNNQNQNIAGEYWCRSYNYNGAGGSCQLQRPLILNADGSYSFGTTSGKYTSFGDKITFDGGLSSRGPATYTTDKEIIWEFIEKDSPYTITYYLRSQVE